MRAQQFCSWSVGLMSEGICDNRTIKVKCACCMEKIAVVNLSRLLLSKRLQMEQGSQVG